MKSEDRALKVIIDKMDNINTVLNTTRANDDLYYDAIKSLSQLKLSELREGFSEINNFLIEMGKLNFNQRVPIDDNDSIINYIATALNFLCEELQEKVLPKHQEILNLLEEMVIVTDVDGTINYCNSTFASIFGLHPTYLMGIKMVDLMVNNHVTLDFKKQGFYLNELDIEFNYMGKKLNTAMNITEISGTTTPEFIFIGKMK